MNLFCLEKQAQQWPQTIHIHSYLLTLLQNTGFKLRWVLDPLIKTWYPLKEVSATGRVVVNHNSKTVCPIKEIWLLKAQTETFLPIYGTFW